MPHQLPLSAQEFQPGASHDRCLCLPLGVMSAPLTMLAFVSPGHKMCLSLRAQSASICMPSPEPPTKPCTSLHYSDIIRFPHLLVYSGRVIRTGPFPRPNTLP